MALIDSKTYRLKDGAELIVRVGETRDAESILKNGQSFIEDGEGQVMVPGEFNLSLDEEIKWVENHRQKPTHLLLVAELDGQLVGHIDFYGGSRKRLQHTGHFGMGISLPFRGRGIGKALLSRLIEWAESNPQLEKINLNVLSSNARAIVLYQSLGFVEVGRRKNEFKLSPGNYVDDVAMELMLS